MLKGFYYVLVIFYLLLALGIGTGILDPTTLSSVVAFLLLAFLYHDKASKFD